MVKRKDRRRTVGELRDGRCDCTVESLGHELWEVPCGCPEGGDGHMVRFYRDDPVHFKGRHWRLPCAFAAALAENKRLRELLLAALAEEDAGCDPLLSEELAVDIRAVLEVGDGEAG